MAPTSPSFQIAVLLGTPFILFFVYEMFFHKRWSPRGKHCLVTGGSSGLGLALAIELAKSGAHVSIVARSPERLRQALAEIERHRQSPTQILSSYSFSVNTEEGSAAAITAASTPFGDRCPDAYFLCAGASRPGFFIEQTEASLKEGIEITYYAQAFTALAATKAMVKQGVKGRVVFCASILGYFSLVGYSTYSPGKFALRGLAETLQSEYMLYGINVHVAFPGTMYTKGYEEENACKPKITLKVEETDGGWEPGFVAAAVIKGVRNGKYHITVDFIGNVFRTSTAGASQRNSYALDWVHALIGYVALPVWRHLVDRKVRAHRDEHRQYLRERGLATRSPHTRYSHCGC